jgi:hypothetical protein
LLQNFQAGAQLLPLLCSPNAANKNDTARERDRCSPWRGRDGALLSSKFTGEGEERRVCGERLGRRCLLFHEPTWNRAAFSAMFF